jgi:hypothetical protein
MKKIRINDKVLVNKDIYRYEEQYEVDLRNKGIEHPNPKTLEEYQAVDWALWRRHKKLYATNGESGVVVDIFHDFWGGYRNRGIRFFAKVQIDGKIKTFRTTSLEKI